MIESLRIQEFGKWNRRSWAFSKTNFIFGKNESGKSTIADAIRWALGVKGMKKNEILAKGIVNRFPEVDESSVSLEGDLPVIPESERKFYLSCISFREGEIEEITSMSGIKENEWQNFIRSKFLQESINLNDAIQALDKKISPNKNSTEGRNREKLEQESKQLERDLISAKQEFIELRSAIEKLEVAEKEKKEREKIFQDIESQILKLQKERQMLEKCAQKKVLGEILELEVKWKSAEESLNSKKFYEKNEETVWEQLESKGKQLETEIQKLRTLASTLELEIENKKKECGLESKTKEVLDKQSTLLERLTQKLNEAFLSSDLLSETIQKEPNLKGRWIGWIGLSFSFMSLLSSAYFYFLIQSSRLGLGLFLLGLFFLALSLFSFFRKVSVRTFALDLEKERAFLKSLRQTYQEETGDFRIKDYETKDEFIRFASLIREQLVSSKTKVQFLEKEIQEKENLVSSLEPQIERLRKNLYSNEEDKSARLRSWNVSSFEEYKQKRRDFELSQQAVNALSERLAELSKGMDVNLFLTKTKNEFDTLGSVSGPEDVEQSLKICLQNLREAEELSKSESQKVSESNALWNRLKGTLENRERIEQNYERFLKKNFENEQRKLELLRMIEVWKRTKNLFQEMENQNSDTMKQAIAVFQEEWAHFFPGKNLGIENFSDAEIRISDAGEELRKLPQLSTGTRGLFYFLFKLTLARRIVPRGGLVLLDESLLFFDKERLGILSQYLKRIQDQFDLQIFVFTKQEALMEILSPYFPEANRIDL